MSRPGLPRWGAGLRAGRRFDVGFLSLWLVVACAEPEPAPASTAAAEARAPAASLDSCPDCNVVLVSVDTLRADHLGTYGYAQPTSPGLDALAARGVLFEHAYSASYVTADAHMSIFTSLSPSVHGVENAVPGERHALRLSEDLGTLPEWLAEAGYATAAFTSGGNVGAVYGFDRGMDTYQVHSTTETGVERALKFARAQHAAGKPFFVFMHTYETHDPYLPPEDVAQLFYEPYMGDVARTREELLAREPDLTFEAQRDAYWAAVDEDDPIDVRQVVAAYDAEIRSVDGALQALWSGIAPLGRTLLIVTSDHGEQFGEHGGFLHNDLYDELLHVPLVVVHPDGPAGVRVAQPVSTMDIAPTLLDLLELPARSQAQGRSLAPLGALPTAPVFAERNDLGQALIAGHDKLIWRPERRPELYDLDDDPFEERDRAQSAETDLAQLETLRLARHERNLQRRTDGQGEARTHALDPHSVAQLKALGYGD